MLNQLPSELQERVYDLLPARDRIKMKLVLPKHQSISKTMKTDSKNDKNLGVISAFLKKCPQKKLFLTKFLKNLIEKNIEKEDVCKEDVNIILNSLDETDKKRFISGKNKYKLEEILIDGNISNDTLDHIDIDHEYSILFNSVIKHITPSCLELLVSHPNTRDYFYTFLKHPCCLWSCFNFCNFDLFDHIYENYKNVINIDNLQSKLISNVYYTKDQIEFIANRNLLSDSGKDDLIAYLLSKGDVDLATILM